MQSKHNVQHVIDQCCLQNMELVSKSQHSLPGYAFLHDFTVTKHYYIIFKNPVSLDLMPFLLGRKTAVHAVRWEPNRPLTAHLIPRPQCTPLGTSLDPSATPAKPVSGQQQQTAEQTLKKVQGKQGNTSQTSPQPPSCKEDVKSCASCIDVSSSSTGSSTSSSSSSVNNGSQNIGRKMETNNPSHNQVLPGLVQCTVVDEGGWSCSAHARVHMGVMQGLPEQQQGQQPSMQSSAGGAELCVLQVGLGYQSAEQFLHATFCHAAPLL